MFKKIVAALDSFPPLSDVALSTALEMAATHGAHVTFVHAVRLVPPPMLRIDALPRTAAGWIADDAQRQRAFEIIEAVETRAKASSVEYSTIVAFGDPADVIASIVDVERADLVVLGSRRRTGLAHMLEGSVAEGVLRRTEVPLLIAALPADVRLAAST